MQKLKKPVIFYRLGRQTDLGSARVPTSLFRRFVQNVIFIRVSSPIYMTVKYTLIVRRVKQQRERFKQNGIN